MNTYDQFERERLRLLSEMDKFMEKQQQIRYSFSGRPFDPNTGTYLSPEEEQEQELKNLYYCSKQQQKPMTREEAEKKADCDYKLPFGKYLINTLEQLGLLKFEEVSKKQVEVACLKDLQVVHRFQDKNGMEYHVRDKYLGAQIDLKWNQA